MWILNTCMRWFSMCIDHLFVCLLVALTWLGLWFGFDGQNETERIIMLEKDDDDDDDDYYFPLWLVCLYLSEGNGWAKGGRTLKDDLMEKIMMMGAYARYIQCLVVHISWIFAVQFLQMCISTHELRMYIFLKEVLDHVTFLTAVTVLNSTQLAWQTTHLYSTTIINEHHELSSCHKHTR